jgi:hypothetical protein
MATIGIELADAGFVTAICDPGEPRLLDVPDRSGVPEWPGFCYADGANLTFGRPAEDQWFVQPRRVVHNFWARLAHEPSTLNVSGKPPSFSELAFFFLRDYAGRLSAAAPHPEKVVLAVPGAYLKDSAAEEEKIGLLLGMIGELKLPLAGMIDSALAALCDPRAPGFNRNLPVVVVDLGLDGADLTLLTTEGRLARKDFIHLPQCGLSFLLKQLTSTMGNRFLRHTAFDILEDGRIEQTFFRQTKDFLCSEAPEFRFLINTATRAYEMTAKREQLATDSHSFLLPLVQGLQSFVRNSPHGSEPCTVALTDRTARLPGLEARLRAAGFGRLLRLPPGAAAAGAARIGASRLKAVADLAEIDVETSVALSEARARVLAPWEVRLVKLRTIAVRRPPTHAILAGIGRALGPAPRFTIGLAEQAADLPLPDDFGLAQDLAISLQFEDGRLWLVDSGIARDGATPPEAATRTAIEAGDQLIVRCGPHTAEVLFAHCPSGPRPG